MSRKEPNIYLEEAQLIVPAQATGNQDSAQAVSSLSGTDKEMSKAAFWWLMLHDY